MHTNRLQSGEISLASLPKSNVQKLGRLFTPNTTTAVDVKLRGFAKLKQFQKSKINLDRAYTHPHFLFDTHH